MFAGFVVVRLRLIFRLVSESAVSNRVRPGLVRSRAPELDIHKFRHTAVVEMFEMRAFNSSDSLARSQRSINRVGMPNAMSVLVHVFWLCFLVLKPCLNAKCGCIQYVGNVLVHVRR